MSDEQTLFTPADAQAGKQHALTSYLKTLEGEEVDVDRIELTDNGDVELEYPMLEDSEFQQANELRYIGGAYTAVQNAAGLGDLEVTMHTEWRTTILPYTTERNARIDV